MQIPFGLIFLAQSLEQFFELLTSPQWMQQDRGLFQQLNSWLKATALRIDNGLLPQTQIDRRGIFWMLLLALFGETKP